MRLLVIASLSCVSVLALSTPAAAYPIENEPQLTENALYGYGKLPASKCAEKSVKGNDSVSAKAYILAIFRCLDATWGKHLTANEVPFEKAKVTFVKRLPKRWCGMRIPADDSQYWYCPATDGITYQLGRSWLGEPDNLWLSYTAARAYGYHVQRLVGIQKAKEGLRYYHYEEWKEQLRRQALQGDCLSGVFLRSVWPLKGRSAKEVSELYGQFSDSVIYGKKKSIAYWVKRGFATGDPGSCNTWTASSKQVA
ncbi:neutral zinc metallopeptidase [Nonomuraea turkmeniaca]|uniref:neutral zinc metallopeptidase n=1 Tax=Nonomuraea turkmeniaca TaxID=103838 RepID=UPI001476905E|nr:neutral zinc metallopeptidase [Nonomuraea turkmeniaca]